MRTRYLWRLQEAAAASALNGTQVVDRALVVEQAAVAAKTRDVGGANPFAAIQQAQVCFIARLP